MTWWSATGRSLPCFLSQELSLISWTFRWDCAVSSRFCNEKCSVVCPYPQNRFCRVQKDSQNRQGENRDAKNLPPREERQCLSGSVHINQTTGILSSHSKPKSPRICPPLGNNFNQALTILIVPSKFKFETFSDNYLQMRVFRRFKRRRPTFGKMYLTESTEYEEDCQHYAPNKPFFTQTNFFSLFSSTVPPHLLPHEKSSFLTFIKNIKYKGANKYLLQRAKLCLDGVFNKNNINTEI